MENPIQTFGPNLAGRDFVIGDLHGSLSCFTNLLKNLDFDPTKDRMFSVGDLVDRGPDSLGCLRLIKEKWFNSVLSNHEQMMVEAFNGGYMGNFWYQNGGDWGHSAYVSATALTEKKTVQITEEEYELIDLLPAVEQLPFLITIEHKSGKKFHVIHAELPPKSGVTDEMLKDPKKVVALATRQVGDGDAFLWGRSLFYQYCRVDLSNIDKQKRIARVNDVYTKYFSDDLSHIISGHTIVHKPITLVGQTNIDTGAYSSYGHVNHSGYNKATAWAGLTCINLDDWTFWKATEEDFRQVTPLVINKADVT